nr:poly(A) polymerase [Hymenolepis microstoma]
MMDAINEKNGDSEFTSLEQTLNGVKDFAVIGDYLTRAKALQLLRSIFQNWINFELERKKLAKADQAYLGLLLTYGSYHLSVCSKDDDIDTALVVPKWISEKSFCFLFGEMLRCQDSVSYVQFVENYGCLLMRTKILGIKFDVVLVRLKKKSVPQYFNISSVTPKVIKKITKKPRRFGGLLTASFILDIVYSKQVFRTALKAIRLWAKECGIYSNTLKYLNGISLAIMTCRICLLYPTEPAETIVYHFMRIYSQWDWRERVRITSDCRHFSDVPHISVSALGLRSLDTLSHVSQDRMRIICRMITDYGFNRMLEIKNHTRPWSYFFERKTFFHTYPYYFALSFQYSNEALWDKFRPIFEKYVRDKSKMYEEKDSVKFAHVNCNAFCGKIGKSKERSVRTWFIGIEFENTEDYFDDTGEDEITGWVVRIRSFKRNQIADYLPPELL